MIKKIDHFVITTKTFIPCVEFYKKLGFTAIGALNHYELYAGDFKINVHLKGNELSPHAGKVACGSADLCFELDVPISDFMTKLALENIAIELGIVERTGVRGKMKSVYIRDIDDNLLEFSSYK